MKIRKIVALLIAVTYAIFSIDILLYLFLPISLIFFSESIGGYTGIMSSFHHPTTETSPGWAVEVVGWLFLLAPILYVFSAAFFV